MSNTSFSTAGLNGYLRSLATRRKSRYVTADDANRYMDTRGFTTDTTARLRAINSVFTEGNSWQSNGSVASERASRRGAQIARWFYRGK